MSIDAHYPSGILGGAHPGPLDDCPNLLCVQKREGAVPDDATLRQRIETALREHYLNYDRAETDADGRAPCVCGGWREPGEMDGDEYGWDSHTAAALLPLFAAELAEAADVAEDVANELFAAYDTEQGNGAMAVAARLRARADATGGQA
jgi:hypothetical protein